jgi:hypothetical protein
MYENCLNRPHNPKVSGLNPDPASMPTKRGLWALLKYDSREVTNYSVNSYKILYVASRKYTIK